MGQTTQELYEHIKDLKTFDEFKEEITQRKSMYDDLFDEETLALLIIDELGRNTQSYSTIADLHPGVENTVVGIVTHIGKPRRFQRRNGSTGSVVNLMLTDETGTIPLVLWGDDVNLITDEKIKQNTKLKIINGYTKKGYQGTEITVGRWSTIEIIEKNHTPNKEQLKQQNPTPEITGFITKISPTTVFFKDDGTYGFVAKLFLQTKKGIQKITLWDDQVKCLLKYHTGDQIKIQNMDIKQNHEGKELHVNGRAIISSC